MKGENKMTHSKLQKESLKEYKHALVTKEDLHPIWMEGLTKKLEAQMEIVKNHDIPFCMNCQKFGGDLIGKCIAFDTKQEAEKLRKEREEKMNIQAIKMGLLVDTDEAEHWIDADRFDLMGEHFRMFKGVKMIATFHKKEVNYIKTAEQPVLHL